jgi:multiple sugar transport system substrate-binding protein
MKHILVIFMVGICTLWVCITQPGCGAERGGRTVLSFWALGSEGDKVRGMVEEFERIHPEITVQLQQIPWTAAHEKLLTAYAGDAVPDICHLGNTWISEFALLKALEPLDGRISRSSIIDRADFFPGILSSNVVDSVTYGIPWYVDTRVLFYRSDLLADVGFPSGPKTWNDVITVCQALQGSRYRIRYPFFFPTNEWAPAAILGVQFGSSLLRDDGTYGDFRGQEFRRGFELLISFYRNGYAPVGLTEVLNRYHAFAEGYYAMYITGPWNIGEFEKRLPAEMQNQWMTAPLPTADSQFPGRSLALGASLVVFRASAHKDDAWKLVEFLTTRDHQLEFYGSTGNLPSRISAWDDSSLTANPHVRAFRTQLDRVEPLPRVPEWEQIAMKLQYQLELAAAGRLSVDETLVSIDEAVDRILEKRRWVKQQSREP